MSRRYNKHALRGFVYCLHFQGKPVNDAYYFLLHHTKRRVDDFRSVENFYRNIKRYKLTEGLNGHEGLKGFLYCLFLQDVPILTAIRELNRAGGDCQFAFEDAEIMYERFKAGKYDMTEEAREEEDQRSSISRLPEHIMPYIVKNLDLNSRLLFRQTCRLHQTLVDEGDFCIDRLALGVNIGYTKIVSSDGFNMIFSLRQKGTMVDEDGQLVVTEGIHWYKWENAIELILNSNDEQVIKKLEVMVYEQVELHNLCLDAAGSLHENVFERLVYPPKVESLHMQFPDFYCLGYVLPYLDSDVIKHLAINFEGLNKIYENEISKHELDQCKRVYKLDQWKHARSFRSNLSMRGGHIQYFSHFNFAKFRVLVAPSVRKILNFKKKLLRNPNLNQIRITTRMRPRSLQTINNIIKTSTTDGTPNQIWAIFNYPNSKKTLSMCVTGTWIWFKGPRFQEDTEPEFAWTSDEDVEEFSESEAEDGDEDDVDDEEVVKGESAERYGYDTYDEDEPEDE